MKIIKYVLSIGILATLTSFLLVVSAEASAPCNGTMSLDQFRSYEASQDIGRDMHINGSTVTATYYNRTGCSIPVNLTSYKAFDNVIANQVLFATLSGTVQPYTTLNLTVNIPNCMSQSDMYYGQTIPYNPASYYPNSYNFGGIMNMVGSYCTNQVPINISCSASPTSAQVGETINWSSSVSGGNSNLSYSWSGTGGLSGSNSSVSKSYSSTGTKTATVTVVSGTQTASASCTASVYVQQSPNLYASCSATPNNVQTGNTINWSSSVSGGNGSYTYSWSGTDNLSGSSQNTSMNYSNAGSKNASVIVTSGSQSVTANCYANVYQVQDYSSYNYGGGWNTYYYPPNNQSLSGSCSSGVTNTTVGSTVTWTATASGGNGFYTYYWYGDEGFSSNSQYAPKTYSYGGTKNAMVTISSNGQSITRNCSVNVGQVLSYTDTQPYLSSVYLSEIPYTGAGDGLRVTLFVLALTLWSALISYALIGRKGENFYGENI